MAKTESTAVNELIASMQSGTTPPAKDPGDDLFAPQPAKPARMTSTIPPMRGAGEVSPLPRNRAPHGTSQHQLPKHAPPVRISTAPPSRATTIPPLAKTPVPQAPPSQSPPPRRSAPPQPQRASLPPPQRASQPPASAPVAAPFEAKAQRPITIDAPGDAIHADQWFEASRAVDKVEKIDQSWGTMAVPRTRPASKTRKLIAPALVLAAAGVAVGGYLALRGDGVTKPHQVPPTAVVTAPAPKPKIEATPVAPPPPSAESVNAATATAGGSQPEPPAKEQAPAPVVAPAPAPAPAPAAAPAEAPAAETHEVQTTRGVVKLVDVRIDSKPAGATVMLVDNGKTTFLGNTPVAASLDPTRAYDVVFTLANHPTQMIHVDPNQTHHVELDLVHRGAKAPSAEAAVAPKAAGKGTLMVTSKPPCEIWIDGASTGLTTPQKAIPLVAGSHKITFVNTADNVNKTFPVTITANQSTKLIENLMQ